MGEGPCVSLILPAYNERGRIGQTIGEARGYFEGRGLTYEIIVAADGDDGTREHVAAMAAAGWPNLRVLGGVERRGKGRGIREAVRLARGRVIGFADADNKTPVSELDRFLPHLQAGCDLVIGSRGLPESRIERRQKLYRRVGSKLFGLFLRSLICLPGVRDTQCGFKFFRHDVAKDLFARQRIDGYMFDVEILHLAFKSGYRVVQVPVRWRDDGDSRLALVRGNLRNLIDIFKIRFGRRHAAARPTPKLFQAAGRVFEPRGYADPRGSKTRPAA